ncbi:MAG: CRISPR-associated endonuclease Cas2 [Nitrospirae bacterium]|nr:CRISPR-associated endonuclease Cas2 [Nitrospirota bacterium]
MEELTHYVFYDIEIDRIRNKIAEICKDYGLERIQFSGFAGRLNRNRREEFFLKLTDAIKEGSGKILILPVCEKDFKSILEYIKEEEDAKSNTSQSE